MDAFLATQHLEKKDKYQRFVITYNDSELSSVWPSTIRLCYYNTQIFEPSQDQIILVWRCRYKEPFEPRLLGWRVVLSGHFYASPHVGHARRKQASIKVQEYLPEAQIKTKQTNTVYLEKDVRICIVRKKKERLPYS